MRYEARAYGTRQEIIGELENNLGAQRSPRREQQARDAIAALGNQTVRSVEFGHKLYIVTDDEP